MLCAILALAASVHALDLDAIKAKAEEAAAKAQEHVEKAAAVAQEHATKAAAAVEEHATKAGLEVPDVDVPELDLDTGSCVSVDGC